MISSFTGILDRLDDATGKLDTGGGEEGGKGEVAIGPRVFDEGKDEEAIAAPGVVLAGNVEDEVE